MISKSFLMHVHLLAVFCISVHSRCMELLLKTREVDVARVRSSAIS